MANVFKEIPATIASGASVSTAIRIKGFEAISLELPTFAAQIGAATAVISLDGAETSDGTFRAIHCYSAASGYNLLATPAGTGGFTVLLGPNAKYLPQYIKVRSNTNATAAGYEAIVHVYF
jgi:hypothetical protein